MSEGMELTKENVDKYIDSPEVRKYYGDRRITYSDIGFTDEDIQRIVQCIKSDENQDIDLKDLQDYKDLPDNELAEVIKKRIETEYYNALQRLFKEQNT